MVDMTREDVAEIRAEHVIEETWTKPWGETGGICASCSQFWGREGDSKIQCQTLDFCDALEIAWAQRDDLNKRNLALLGELDGGMQQRIVDVGRLFSEQAEVLARTTASEKHWKGEVLRLRQELATSQEDHRICAENELVGEAEAREEVEYWKDEAQKAEATTRFWIKKVGEAKAAALNEAADVWEATGWSRTAQDWLRGRATEAQQEGES